MRFSIQVDYRFNNLVWKLEYLLISCLKFCLQDFCLWQVSYLQISLFSLIKFDDSRCLNEFGVNKRLVKSLFTHQWFQKTKQLAHIHDHNDKHLHSNLYFHDFLVGSFTLSLICLQLSLAVFYGFKEGIVCSRESLLTFLKNLAVELRNDTHTKISNYTIPDEIRDDAFQKLAL